MKLKRLNAQTLGTASRWKATIRMTRSGIITLSTKTAEYMELKPGDYIEIMQDEENPTDFFLVRSSSEYGFKLRQFNGTKHLIMHSSKLAAKFFESLNIVPEKKSIGCQMAHEYTLNGGDRLWPIITSSAS